MNLIIELKCLKCDWYGRIINGFKNDIKRNRLYNETDLQMPYATPTQTELTLGDGYKGAPAPGGIIKLGA